MSYLYSKLISNKKKERFDIILEPLQAILQLAFLSSTPIDTKINIYNNILYIQPPNWSQSIYRTYYNDSKNDLFYLFSAITRFNKFYGYLSTISNSDTNLFNLLSEMAKTGIDHLLQTYKQTDNPALLHTLVIYKNILNPCTTSNSSTKINLHNTSANHSTLEFDVSNINFSNQQNNWGNIENFHLTTEDTTSTTSINNKIDDVFIDIRKLYSNNDLTIIFNTLILLRNNPQNYYDYINGLNGLLEPINRQIKNWISDNIVY